jgi:hypothetical protein
LSLQSDFLFFFTNYFKPGDKLGMRKRPDSDYTRNGIYPLIQNNFLFIHFSVFFIFVNSQKTFCVVGFHLFMLLLPRFNTRFDFRVQTMFSTCFIYAICIYLSITGVQHDFHITPCSCRLTGHTSGAGAVIFPELLN